ncbi:MAG: class I SAM-dependent RNA methyltransferase [Acidimicrobiales bacterium]
MDHVTLDITTIVAGGDGLARDADGRVTFVAGALPGEQVTAVVHERKKDFAKATVADVLVASPDRVSAPCRFVAEGCGGCDWQHVAPSGQRRLKAEIVGDALRRQAHLDIEVGLGPELPATGYRTTLRGVAVDGRFGFRHRGSHDIVAVAPCLVAHPLLDELVSHGRFPDGEVILRAGARTGERLAVVHGDREAVSVPEGVRIVTQAELNAGTRAWYHEELAGRSWRISARSFFQARPDGAEVLIDSVRGALAEAVPDGGHVIDLYGGVGLFAGTIDAEKVTLVESGASSVADARVNLADLDIRIVKVDVGRWHPARADAVVADPPRTGLAAAGVAAVVATHADRVALVSCDPAALGRDAKLLGAAGYRLVDATLIDLFPHTSHVEVVSRFERA